MGSGIWGCVHGATQWTQHDYVSLYFKPMTSYTRTQRLTVIFTILFLSVVGTR